jgi:hypothetical protein
MTVKEMSDGSAMNLAKKECQTVKASLAVRRAQRQWIFYIERLFRSE